MVLELLVDQDFGLLLAPEHPQGLVDPYAAMDFVSEVKAAMIAIILVETVVHLLVLLRQRFHVLEARQFRKTHARNQL
jgi:hypothetical protein